MILPANRTGWNKTKRSCCMYIFFYTICSFQHQPYVPECFINFVQWDDLLLQNVAIFDEAVPVNWFFFLQFSLLFFALPLLFKPLRFILENASAFTNHELIWTVFGKGQVLIIYTNHDIVRPNLFWGIRAHFDNYPLWNAKQSLWEKHSIIIVGYLASVWAKFPEIYNNAGKLTCTCVHLIVVSDLF